MAGTGDIIKRIYSSFRGIDLRGNEGNLTRSPDSLNMWRDYKNTQSIETRPCMELHTAFDGKIYGIFFYRGFMLVHSGTQLYKVEDGQKTLIYTGLARSPSCGFVYNNIFYFKDGTVYLQYDGTTLSEVAGYVPTTTIARKPAGGGTVYEDVNMLTGYRINSFLADGKSTEYYLDTTDIDSDFTPVVYIDGVQQSDFSVDYRGGVITFNTAPSAPLTDGQDNVTVRFLKTNEAYRSSILNCTLLQVFDNRVFCSGNKDYPNVVWHCSLNDPTYFSDLDYYREGMDTAEIKGMVAGNNALWVFREPSEANTNVFYHTPTIDEEYGKIYPCAHSSITMGCVGKAINFNDDIVFFSPRGMEGVGGDVTTEQFAVHRSTLADRLMTSEVNYKDMILEEWEGYLLIFIGDKVFLADSRAVFTNEGHPEYEFYMWQMEQEITCAKVYEGILYLGTGDGVYTLTDRRSSVESWWTTSLDKFNAPNMAKTTNKRGSVVEARGEEISVYVRTNKMTDFEFVNTYHNVTDAFVCRIKKKKFKDLQLKFYSAKRFRLESA